MISFVSFQVELINLNAITPDTCISSNTMQRCRCSEVNQFVFVCVQAPLEMYHAPSHKVVCVPRSDMQSRACVS